MSALVQIFFGSNFKATGSDSAQRRQVTSVITLNRKYPNAVAHPGIMRPMKAEIVGVLFDRCGKQPGSALGPEAIRYAFERHDRRDVRLMYRRNVSQWHEVRSKPRSEDRTGLRYFNEALACYFATQDHVEAVLGRGHTPIVLGGDHSIALGSVPVAHRHVQKQGGKLAVLWIDAHADVNDPHSSHTGNLHGMPIAAMLGRDYAEHPKGLKDHQWKRLIEEAMQGELMVEGQFAWLGLRDVDLGEARTIAKGMPGSMPISMEVIDRHGLLVAFEKFTQWFARSGCTHLWISFDVDVLDPVLAPGTGTAVRGGLSYREAHLLAELINEQLFDKLVGLDVVEVNPILDSNNATVRVATEWLASLFGKRILPWGPRV